MKLFLICLLGLTASFCTVHAQRSIDASLTMVNPEPETLFLNRESREIKFAFFNNGPDTLEAYDTIRFFYIYNNQPLFTDNQGNNIILFQRAGRTLYPGDSLHIWIFASIDNPTNGTITANLCAFAEAQNRGTDSLKVEELHEIQDNYDCSSIYLSNNYPQSIQEQTASGLEIYPNPVSPGSTLQIKTSWKGPARIRLTDLQGKEILYTELHIPTPGIPLELNIPVLNPGSYLLQISNDAATLNRSLTIQP